MGTRNLTCVFFEGEYKVSQYGQWDGYPSGQGQIAFRFMKFAFRRDRFIAGLRQCQYPTEDEVMGFATSCGAENGMMNENAAKKWKERYPGLSRETGAKILDLVQHRGDKTFLRAQVEFAKDSVFCEWAYVVDLDTNMFEVFKGINTKRLTPQDRFYSDHRPDDSGYYPVRLLGSYSLLDMPHPMQFVREMDAAADARRNEPEDEPEEDQPQAGRRALVLA